MQGQHGIAVLRLKHPNITVPRRVRVPPDPKSSWYLPTFHAGKLKVLGAGQPVKLLVFPLGWGGCAADFVRCEFAAVGFTHIDARLKVLMSWSPSDWPAAAAWISGRANPCPCALLRGSFQLASCVLPEWLALIYQPLSERDLACRPSVAYKLLIFF